MAVDNILHMIENYKKCSVCRMIVLVWLMDDQWVRDCIENGISGMNLEVRSVTLVCGQEELIYRWKNDRTCEWRTNEWLGVSLKSLSAFKQMENCIDTSGLSIEEIARAVMQ